MRSAARPVPRLLEGKRPGLKRIYREIRTDLDGVEKKLKAISRSSVPLISETGGYLFQKSGKRIRPALVLLGSKIFRARGPERILLSALVEVIHTASLIHDDIIDNSGTRRGKPTLNAKWGPFVTVLLGDHLYIKSIVLSLGSRIARAATVLTEASMLMIEGEIQEYGLNGDLSLPEKRYLEIIGKKTAALFSASCRLGGLLGGASIRQEQALADYGYNLGLGFQIVDDVLDYTGEESTVGKPVLADMIEGRVTLPLIHALKQDGQGLAARVKLLRSDGRNDLQARREIIDRVKAAGGVEYALGQAARFCGKAKDNLSALPRTASSEALAILADYVLGRDR